MRNTSYILRSLALLCSFTLVSHGALAEPATSKKPEHSRRALDLQADRAQRAEIHEWLMSEQVGLGRNIPISVHVSEDERREIDTARGQAPERVGVIKPLTRGVSFADVNLTSLKGAVLIRETGALQGTEDGGYVFTAALNSPEAAGIRVHFTDFRLPDAAGVYLYSDDGQVFGPYTGRGPLGDGEFWSHTLMGDEVFLQLVHVGPARSADLASTSFNIAGLGHLRPRFLGGPCGYNAECVEILACGETANPATDIAQDAVAHMQWVSGAFINFCSGGLLSDTVDDSQVPYFLTANHCISRGKDARSLETFFKLNDVTRDTVDCSTTPLTCDDWAAVRSNHPASLRTLGATIRATDRTSDYTLLELRQDAPAGTQFLGWDASPIAHSDGTPLFRISHPSGAPQAYSEHEVDTSYGTCSSWPRGDWIYSRDTFGATEGGSSGSPVVNSSGEVVGQLSGACGTNVSDTCDSVQNATVDGAFAAYYSEIAHILDPSPAECTPTESPEISCGDDLDNDCDGLVDTLDSDCSGGGGFPAGATCEINSECGSGNCKGKPGRKTCK